MQPFHRMIATLEAEAAMIESHAAELIARAYEFPECERRSQLLQLADEESTESAKIRHEIRLLRDHLKEFDSRQTG
jgi:hypothetical protein